MGRTPKTRLTSRVWDPFRPLSAQYVARFIGGSNASALGAFSALITSFADVLFILGVANFKPKFAAGGWMDSWMWGYLEAQPVWPGAPRNSTPPHTCVLLILLRLHTGPPKQFAALCGVMFSTLAFFFYLMHVHEEKLNIVGLSFTCALGAAALMESAIE